jgi:hypothetical protein
MLSVNQIQTKEGIMNKKLILFLTSFVFVFTADCLLAQPITETEKEDTLLIRPFKECRIGYPSGSYVRKVFSETDKDILLQATELPSYGNLYRNGYCIGFTQVYDKESLPENCSRGYTTYDLKGHRYHLFAYNGIQIVQA